MEMGVQLLFRFVFALYFVHQHDFLVYPLVLHHGFVMHFAFDWWFA